jgi:hypothetical protein
MIRRKRIGQAPPFPGNAAKPLMHNNQEWRASRQFHQGPATSAGLVGMQEHAISHRVHRFDQLSEIAPPLDVPQAKGNQLADYGIPGVLPLQRDFIPSIPFIVDANISRWKQGTRAKTADSDVSSQCP